MECISELTVVFAYLLGSCFFKGSVVRSCQHLNTFYEIFMSRFHHETSYFRVCLNLVDCQQKRVTQQGRIVFTGLLIVSCVFICTVRVVRIVTHRETEDILYQAHSTVYTIPVLIRREPSVHSLLLHLTDKKFPHN